MTKNNYQKKLFYEKQIKKAIKKYSRKHTPNVDEIRKLKCQTVEPWKRILAIIIGLSFNIFSLFLIEKAPDAFLIIIALFIVGLIIIILGILGNKKTIDEMILKTGDGLMEAILNNL